MPSGLPLVKVLEGRHLVAGRVPPPANAGRGGGPPDKRSRATETVF